MIKLINPLATTTPTQQIIAILILLVAVFYAVVIKSDIEIFDKLREFITESYAYKWAIENLIPEKIYEFLK